MQPAGATLELQHLYLGYANNIVAADINATITASSLVAIVGPNGAGKTTLLKAVAGLLRPMRGRIVMHGISTRDVSYVPQQIDIVRDFPISVFDMVASGLWGVTGAFKGLSLAAHSRIEESLTAVGLRGFESRRIGTLSGGEFQRMLFARLILRDARIILMDEPFSHIDEATTQDLMKLVIDWQRSGRTVIAALHDISLVRRQFPHVLRFARGRVAFGASHELLAKQDQP